MCTRNVVLKWMSKCVSKLHSKSDEEVSRNVADSTFESIVSGAHHTVDPHAWLKVGELQGFIHHNIPDSSDLGDGEQFCFIYIRASTSFNQLAIRITIIYLCLVGEGEEERECKWVLMQELTLTCALRQVAWMKGGSSIEKVVHSYSQSLYLLAIY
jgi:hypothetical protein